MVALRVCCIAALLFLAAVAGAAIADDPNWLTNSGFEEAAGDRPAGWDLGMEGRGQGEAVWQEGGAHSGTRCLRVKLSTEGDYYMGRQRVSQPVAAGALHQIRGWYRSDAEMVAHPCVYNVAADGRVISACEAPLARADGWTFFQFAWVPPDGTVRFEVQLRAQAVPGTAWFDDVTVGPAAELEAERRQQLERARYAFGAGPLRLRALRPSERPSLADFAEPARMAELRQARSASLFAARDERESLGIAVLGLAEGQPLTAEVTALAGPGGSRIPPSEVKVCWAETVRVATGAVPDPLLEAQPFRRPADPDAVPMLWVTVHVPRDDVAPGDYSGTVVARSGAQTARLPFALHVYDFALPKTTYLSSSFWVFRHTIRNAYGLKTVPFDFYTRFLDLCLEARLSPIDAAEWHDQPYVHIVRNEDGELDVDFAEWDRYLDYCMDRGMSAFNVADDHWFGTFFRSFPVRDSRTGEVSTVTLHPRGAECRRTVARFFRLAREHFTRRGWADRAYLQAYDEPANDAKLLAEIRGFYAAAREGWPGLRTLITAPPQSHTGLQGSIGIWCPLTPSYEDAVAAERRELGEEVWWYVCCGPTAPWANFFLDQPGAAHRVLFWQTFQRKSDGLLYWGINHWPGFDARTMDQVPAERRWPAVPWEDRGRNGDGYFLYPGPDGPLTSLRFEIMRDGVEDYDALRMLQALVDEKGDDASPGLLARAGAALMIGPEISRSMTSYPLDAGAMVARRRVANELIEELRG